MALVLLLAQAAPACAGVGARLAYVSFHQLEHALQAQLTRNLPMLIQMSPEDLTHTHGPGTEPHTHGSFVELALTTSETADGSEPARHGRTDRRVAPHVPPSSFAAADPLPAQPYVSGRWADAPEPPSTSRRPLVPPPRV